MMAKVYGLLLIAHTTERGRWVGGSGIAAYDYDHPPSSSSQPKKVEVRVRVIFKKKRKSFVYVSLNNLLFTYPGRQG